MTKPGPKPKGNYVAAGQVAITKPMADFVRKRALSEAGFVVVPKPAEKPLQKLTGNHWNAFADLIRRYERGEVHLDNIASMKTFLSYGYVKKQRGRNEGWNCTGWVPTDAGLKAYRAITEAAQEERG